MEGKRKVSLCLVTPPQAAGELNEISIVLIMAQRGKPIVLYHSFLKGQEGRAVECLKTLFFHNVKKKLSDLVSP